MITDGPHKAGDTSSAICPQCERVASTKFVEQDGTPLAVCDDCGMPVGISPESVGPELVVETYDAGHRGDRAVSSRVCIVEGNCMPLDRPSFSVLAEAWHILVQFSERHSTVEIAEGSMTAIVGRRDENGTLAVLARLDVEIYGESAHARVSMNHASSYDVEPVHVGEGDDIVEVMSRILTRADEPSLTGRSLR